MFIKYLIKIVVTHVKNAIILIQLISEHIIANMGQITIYLGTRLAEKAKLAASKAGLSQSRWIATLTEEKLSTDWPDNVKQLVGSWLADFPKAEDIRKPHSQDLDREPVS